jgi:predicted nucleic acid-binding Zn finger protein
MMEDERVTRLIDKRAIKLHIFLPSKRRILTVVGRMREYWVDIDLKYCTCKGYYFRSIARDDPCYHLKAAINAAKEGLTDTVVFDDDEYEGFLRALIHDVSKAIINQSME